VVNGAAMSSSVCNLGDPGFPPALVSIPGPPKVLYLRGRLPPPPRVAVVGSRDADRYGLEAARALGAGLSAAGVSVVSGGAGGVDTAALEGCLEGPGRPIAVLGTGVDVAYPAANRNLFDKVAESGALVSEYPPKTPGRPAHFPKRNRIISGLAEGVVVVRAAKRSGSLITAREAVRQGRVLMAVPGPAGDDLSAGVHQLIRQGARLVESAADVLELLSIGDTRQATLNLAVSEELPEGEKALMEALGEESCDIDLLSTRTGFGSSQVAALLLQMELKGLVTQRPGMIYCRARESMG
jgi:DNA processing protein